MKFSYRRNHRLVSVGDKVEVYDLVKDKWVLTTSIHKSKMLLLALSKILENEEELI